MSNRLERADLFSKRSSLLQREARTAAAALAPGSNVRCAKCSQPATKMKGGQFLCELDLEVVEQRAEMAKLRLRAAMKSRA